MVPDEDPDDLVQETYLRAWRSLSGFRGESSVLTWMLSIARRVCIDAVTKAARHRAAFRNQTEAPLRPTTADPMAGVDLGELIARLDPDRREVFVLTQILGLSYAEAAGVADCEVGTVRSRVGRARAQLIRWLSDSTSGESTSGAPPSDERENPDRRGTTGPEQPTNSP